MRLQWIDFMMIIIYIIAIVSIGIFQKKRAQKSAGEYLLAGNSLPWYMLGLSNASGMFDISGTMWLVAITFVYGLKSIWIPWLWPVFNQMFLMAYLSLWLRRSNVTTGAEWIETRFGSGREGMLSHNIVVVYALISALGFLAYGFVGLGKFVEIFIPWEIVSSYVPFHVPQEYVPHLYGIVFTAIATFYSILGGMVSIVWADVIQYVIMGVSSVVIAVVAFISLNGRELVVPDGWKSPFFGWKLDLDWSGIINEANTVIAEEGYSLFSIFMMMLLFRGILVSAAGPAPNYDMQKILATKSPREAAMMSGSVSIILMPIRYLMIAGFAVLGILYYNKLDLVVAGRIDFEQILPSAMNEFLPAGFLGLLLVGLMAAFMSTFAGTLNAAQAYVVNDLYLRYINPEAKGKKVSYISYAVGIITVLISSVLGFFAKNVNSVLQWIVAALWGSYVASNVLKWYWWRFNGNGYFWGMISGLIPALIFPLFVPNSYLIYFFPILLLISVAGCIIGTYATPPTDEKVLIKFYKQIRPWGFWKPVHEKVIAKDPGFERNENFKVDMFNVFVATVWQTSLVALPIYLVVKEYMSAAVVLAIIITATFMLKKYWYDRLED